MANSIAAVVINDTEITPIIVNAQPVLTLAMIDQIHSRPEGTARKRLNDNKGRFVSGEDFMKVCADEIRTRKIMEISNKAQEDVIFMTESGYLLLVKSFTDDLAWRIQKQLVQAYFRAGKPNVVGESASTLLPSEQQTLKEIVDRKLSTVDSKSQGKTRAEIWSRVQAKFRVAKYSQLERTQFADAILYITSMELKSMPAGPKTYQPNPDDYLSHSDTQQLSRVIYFISNAFHGQKSASFQIWRALRAAAECPAPFKFEKRHLPVIGKELLRFAKAAENLRQISSNAETALLKSMLRSNGDDPVLMERIQREMNEAAANDREFAKDFDDRFYGNEIARLVDRSAGVHVSNDWSHYSEEAVA